MTAECLARAWRVSGARQSCSASPRQNGVSACHPRAGRRGRADFGFSLLLNHVTAQHIPQQRLFSRKPVPDRRQACLLLSSRGAAARLPGGDTCPLRLCGSAAASGSCGAVWTLSLGLQPARRVHGSLFSPVCLLWGSHLRRWPFEDEPRNLQSRRWQDSYGTLGFNSRLDPHQGRGQRARGCERHQASLLCRHGERAAATHTCWV